MSVVNMRGEAETEIKNASEFWNEADFVIRTEGLTIHTTLTLDAMKLLMVQLAEAVGKIEDGKIVLSRS